MCQSMPWPRIIPSPQSPGSGCASLVPIGSGVARDEVIEVAVPGDHLLPAESQGRLARGVAHSHPQCRIVRQPAEALCDLARIAADLKAVTAILDELSHSVHRRGDDGKAAGGRL